MANAWLLVDALTGAPLADLPDFTIDSVSVVLGQYQTAQGSLPVPTAPENWPVSTLPWASALVLLSDDTGTMQPVGPMWYIQQRIRDQGDLIQLALITAEGYAALRYVGNSTFTATDQNTIATSLVASYLAAGPAGSGLSGIPITSNVVGAAGTLRDRTYADINDQTVYTALTELMGVQGGPEWTITCQHLSSPERYVPVFNVGTRIGSAPAAGLSPAASFEMGGTSPGGSVVSATYTEDYSSGKGANYITATGNPDGVGGRPQQSVVNADIRRPAVEYRFNPSTTIVDTASLLAHAVLTAGILKGGTTALALASKYDEGPLLNVDWSLGDTVHYSIGGKDQNNKETVPEFPGGLVGDARAIGYKFQPDDMTRIMTPILGGV